MFSILFRFHFHFALFYTTKSCQTCINSLPEIQKCFGSDATIGGLKFQFATSIKKNVEQILSARAAGKDCKDIIFSSNGHIEFPSQFFFLRTHTCKSLRHLTASLLLILMLANRNGEVLRLRRRCFLNCLAISRYQSCAKVQKNAVAKGDDPKDFNVDLNYKGQPRAREVHRGKCALKELLSSQHFLLFCIFISRSKTQ